METGVTSEQNLMPLVSTGTAVKGKMVKEVTSEHNLTPLVSTGTAVKGLLETVVTSEQHIISCPLMWM